MSKVIVTNKGETWKARWNGHDYVFETGVPLTIPVFAATFLFNYGRPKEMIHKVLVQNAWLKVSDVNDDFGPVAAEKRLKSFSFKKAPEEERVRPKPIVLQPLTRNSAQPAVEREGEPAKASTSENGEGDGVLSKIASFGKDLVTGNKGGAARAN